MTISRKKMCVCESDSFIELVKKNMPKKCLKKNLTLVFKKTTLMKWEFSRKKKSEKKNGLVDERRC